jgi:hypothetical protein
LTKVFCYPNNATKSTFVKEVALRHGWKKVLNTKSNSKGSLDELKRYLREQEVLAEHQDKKSEVIVTVIVVIASIWVVCAVVMALIWRYG